MVPVAHSAAATRGGRLVHGHRRGGGDLQRSPAASEPMKEMAEGSAGRGSTDVLVGRGRAAFESGDLDAAAEAFEEALTAGAEPGEAFFGLGQIALQRGDTARAAAWFERAADAESAPPEA